jgi:hypothetical protein
MDAARGPPASLGATRSAPHDTLGEPGKRLGRSRWTAAPPAALADRDAACNLACGGFA